MAKKFQVSENSGHRLQVMENLAAEALDNSDEIHPEVERLAFNHDCFLTTEEVAAVLRCSTKTLGTLPVPPIRIGQTIRYSADMVRQFVEHELQVQRDRELGRLMTILDEEV